MPIGGVSRPDDVDTAAWRVFAGEAGLGGQLPAIIREQTERVIAAARRARDEAEAEGWHHPVIEEIVAAAVQRARRDS